MTKPFYNLLLFLIIILKFLVIIFIINNGGILVPDSQSYLDAYKNFFIPSDLQSFTRGDLSFIISSRTIAYPFLIYLSYLFFAFQSKIVHYLDAQYQTLHCE